MWKLPASRLRSRGFTYASPAFSLATSQRGVCTRSTWENESSFTSLKNSCFFVTKKADSTFVRSSSLCGFNSLARSPLRQFSASSLGCRRRQHTSQQSSLFMIPQSHFSSDSQTSTQSQETVQNPQPQPQKKVAIWLFVVSGMVFVMVVVGGLTRLTKSGLSMTDWKFTGEFPPLSQQDWEKEFARYRTYPEFKQVHQSMTLEEFKFIFWMEWSHRMLGRAIGLAFLIPGLYFGLRGQLPGRNLQMRLGGIFGLICGQGLIGWWMVKSGLEEPEQYRTPRVSPYRLATHLLSAFVIYAALLTTGMRCWSPGPGLPVPRRLKALSAAVTHVLGLTVASGAFVAGNQAGLVYNEFPLMGGHLIPDDIIDPSLKPVWKNFFENSTLVQFDHRWLGITTATLVSALWAVSRQPGVPKRIRSTANALAAMAALQVTLGISTLLMYVPVPLAASHQAGSLTLFTIALALRHLILRR